MRSTAWYLVQSWLLCRRPRLRWPAELTYADIQRVKKRAHFDLCSVYAEDPKEGQHALSGWEDLLSDVGVTVNVLRHWLGWSEWETRLRGSQLNAESISEGVNALGGAIDRFFLGLGKGPMFGVAWRAAQRTSIQAQARYGPKLEDLLQKNITEKFGGWPESLESGTQGPTNTGS